MTCPDNQGFRTDGHTPFRGCPECPESVVSASSGVCPELCPDRVRSINRQLDKITAWLERIGETDQATIEQVQSNCRTDSEARAYFLKRASEIVTALPGDDDRIRCLDCRHLDRKVCNVAAPDGVVIAARHYQPNRTKLHRCDGYTPKPALAIRGVGAKGTRSMATHGGGQAPACFTV